MRKYHLFEVIGVEIEYMLVHSKNKNVSPIVDKLLKSVAGAYVNSVERGPIAWSNELVMHVLEFKTNGPVPSLEGLDRLFYQSILEAQELLKPMDAMLLGTAMHPLMDPLVETKIWPHEYHEIYQRYHEMFFCFTPGWANLQSTHINLPFYDDQEFERLHAAIRLLLPLIPGMAASSPYSYGAHKSVMNWRLEYYKMNQARFPEISGMLIPERVYTESAYYEQILNPIEEIMKKHDPEDVMEHHFVNSRGAIARFDRGAIEIRLMDTQECSLADIALVQLFVETVKAWVETDWIPLEDQKCISEESLYEILRASIFNAEKAVIPDFYTKLLGMEAGTFKLNEVWHYIYQKVKHSISERYRQPIEHILEQGTLSTRMLNRYGKKPSKDSLKELMEDLSTCLLSQTQYQ